MTNALSIGLIAAIAAFFAVDYFVLHLDAGVFLLRKLIALIQVVAFWR